MPDTYAEMRSSENIYPLVIPDKEQYYIDLLNIEHSWTGRMDLGVGNAFVMEAEQQLVNAMELFEHGYFDCAYYSLRSAVDLSTTIVFLADLPEEDREKYLQAWKNTDKFPIQHQMIKQLSRNGNIFVDMKQKMPEFFESAKNLSADLNKYVHKQGFQHFYITRNNPFCAQESVENLVSKFEGYLKQSITVVAVMRLAIDPFPILLMDDEVLYRCFDSMTDPYSEEFVTKYIGNELISQYKKTEIYQGTYNSFLSEEKKKQCVFDVMKHQYIDTKKIDEIYSQLHLLKREDIVAVLLAASSLKVVKIYACDGMLMYFTDRTSKRKKLSWSGADFKGFCESKNLMNQAYDEAYISVFQFLDINFFVEHNEILNNEDLAGIVGFVTGALFKMEIIQ